MKNFASETFKYTRPGKPYVEEAPCIEGCLNPKIQENYIITRKKSTVYYAYVLLTITKTVQGKNKFCPFIN